MDPKVDAFIAQVTAWSAEMAAAREILLGCGLDEAIKWGKPCFVHDGANIAIFQPMKEFLSVMFFKGTLMDDPTGALRLQGENSRSAMRIELTSTEDVAARADVLRDLVRSALAVEEAGLSVGPAPEPDLAPELAERLAGDPDLAAAFDGLTPGRRREHNMHIAAAKQSSTREARVDKAVPLILAGKGLRDR